MSMVSASPQREKYRAFPDVCPCRDGPWAVRFISPARMNSDEVPGHGKLGQQRISGFTPEFPYSGDKKVAIRESSNQNRSAGTTQ